MLIAAVTFLCVSFIAVVHVTNHELFVLFNILVGFSISSMHISVNSQAFHDQARGGKNLVVSASGYWSAGSLFATLLSMFLIGKVSLQEEITVLYLVLWVLTVAVILQRHETLVPSNRRESLSRSIYESLRRFNFDWAVNLGFIFCNLLEFSMNDWATIFTKEIGGISSSLAPLSFLCFTVFMIIGRVSITRLRNRFKLTTLVKFGGMLAGSSFIFGIWTVKYFGLVGLMVTFALAGLGSSYIGPSFLNIANVRMNLPPSVVIGQVSAVNAVLAWILRQVIAFMAQLVGLQVALMIPAVMVLSVGLFNKVFSQAPAKP